MAQAPIRRLVVLVDGYEHPQSGSKNEPSIARLRQVIAEGTIDSNGQQVVQTVRCFSTSPNTGSVGAKPSKLVDKFKSKVSVDTDELIRAIVKEVCYILESPDDELFLYGSGHGSFIVRAVAGIMHHMGLLKREFLDNFGPLYDSVLAFMKARLRNDGSQSFLGSGPHSDRPPRIPFMGLFDSVQLHPAKHAYDLGFTPSLKCVRMALAMNENRSKRDPLTFDGEPCDTSLQSYIQAWFLGTMDDMIGGSPSDGLSLYPLQWMFVESLKANLALTLPEKQSMNNNLHIAFPQFSGQVPSLGSQEGKDWHFRYANGIQVTMFDLQNSHALKGTNDNDKAHIIKFEPDQYSRRAVRPVFGKDGLVGWKADAPFGSIVHPSAFCILDRQPNFLQLPRLKALKSPLARSRDEHLMEGDNVIPPWLEDTELQASGVKAFRILVCGKTGVGKSTLINKIFGVEMTEESNSYKQGVHNIEEAFQSPANPGLLIHDSRGWQAGSDTELELIEKFLQHRATQKDPAEALHVIWFCVDADVSRIEEADKRTFAVISRFSDHVPVFLVGTKKDKLMSLHKMQLLEQFMEKYNDYKEASRRANEEAGRLADEQFYHLTEQLSKIEHYAADGYVCLSKDDEPGIKKLVSQTLGLIADERVRLFCVAAQIVDVDQKIDAAITETMRLGTHGIRSSLAPLPFAGVVTTPTVSRLICESILQCFGFKSAAPEEIEEIMKRIVMGHLSKYIAVTLTQSIIVAGITTGIAVATMGAAASLYAVAHLLQAPSSARMLLKSAGDMILILERAFRYGGSYVSVKQIEDGARYYTTASAIKLNGKEQRLQEKIHDQIDKLLPLNQIRTSLRFNRLRGQFEDIVYGNRFGLPPEYVPETPVQKPGSPQFIMAPAVVELPASIPGPSSPLVELQTTQSATVFELEGALPGTTSAPVELDSTEIEPASGVTVEPAAVPMKSEAALTPSIPRSVAPSVAPSAADTDNADTATTNSVPCSTLNGENDKEFNWKSLTSWRSKVKSNSKSKV